VIAPCHASSSEDDAKDMKASLTKGNLDAKVVKDEAFTLGDKPAWQLVFEITHTNKQTITRPNRPPQVIEHKSVSRITEVTCVQGNLHCFVLFNGPAPDGNEPTIRQMISSFHWDESGPAK
jgi:hypothetical protein